MIENGIVMKVVTIVIVVNQVERAGGWKGGEDALQSCVAGVFCLRGHALKHRVQDSLNLVPVMCRSVFQCCTAISILATTYLLNLPLQLKMAS